jgi:hypothetical protein
MAYKSTYDPDRKADLKKQSARGKSIQRRRKDIDKWRASPDRITDYKRNYPGYSPTFFERETIDVDVPTRKEIPDRKRGFWGDLKTMGRDLSGIAGIDSGNKPGIIGDATTMVEDLIINPAKKYLPGTFGGVQRGLDSLTNNLAQNEENEEILGNAYSDEVRKAMMSPSDRAYYENYIKIGDSKSGQEADYYYDEARKALENAQITRRVNNALGQEPFGFDTSAEVGTHNVDYGTLSSRLQSGLQGTKGGREFLSDVIPKGEALRDTGMIGNAAANIAAAQEAGKAGFFEPWMNEEFVSASPEGVSIEDIQIQPKPLSPGDEEERAFQESLMNDPYVQENFDPETGTWRAPTPITHVPPNPTIDERAGTGYTDYRGVNPFTEPYVPMEGPSPVPLPPYLSENTDWFTPEPEAKGLIPRGLEELMIDQYGVDAPGVERESEWPNTPPPGYQPPPPWYSKAWDWMKEGPWPTY